MVELPEVVGVETVTIDGKEYEKKNFADGSYGIEHGSSGIEVHYPNNDVKTFKKKNGKEYYLMDEKLADGTHRVYDVFVHETRTSRLIGLYHGGKGAMHRVAKHYLQSETLPNGTVNTYYPYGKNESVKKPSGEYKKWTVRGLILQEITDNKVVDYKYDENGNLNYHAVNGVEDTVKYLAMKKVAARQAQKSEKLREQHVEYTDANGNVREKQAVEKLKPLQKTVQMLKAMREVKKSLKR